MRTVEKIIEGALGLKAGSIKEEDGVKTISKWDSLGHLKILTELDIEFDGKLAEIDTLAEAKSVKDIKEILRAKGFLRS